MVTIKLQDMYVDVKAESFRTRVQLPPPPPKYCRQPVSPGSFTGTTGFLFALKQIVYAHAHLSWFWVLPFLPGF